MTQRGAEHDAAVRRAVVGGGVVAVDEEFRAAMRVVADGREFSDARAKPRMVVPRADAPQPARNRADGADGLPSRGR